jgi:hypothetical protein
MSAEYVMMILLTIVFKMSVAFGVEVESLMAIVIVMTTNLMSVAYVVDQVSLMATVTVTETY